MMILGCTLLFLLWLIRKKDITEEPEQVNNSINNIPLARNAAASSDCFNNIVHVNIQGNEIADALAKAGADDASVPSAPLTYLELFSRDKSRNKTIWIIPPEHHWYQGSRPGLSLDCNRRDQTTPTRFLNGYPINVHNPSDVEKACRTLSART
ncbi:hypothetical protein AVEN_275066-1 [Araneus ventricosus]|uniref:RNase H type-1 domain-containing protein n=1 Tax=Araneus ventricosus TaxID=182803 RepID=A0A4Y2LX63_ARAVE|nr:hypothetical protein AVEN_275066-1 [Araneus ventricosus]